MLAASDDRMRTAAVGGQDAGRCSNTMTQDAGSRPVWPEPSRRNVLGAVLGIVVLALALLALLFFTINDLLVDRMWFESQDQLPVWDLRTFGRILLWIPVSVVAFILLTALGLAGRRAAPTTRRPASRASGRHCGAPTAPVASSRRARRPCWTRCCAPSTMPPATCRRGSSARY